MGGQRRQQIGRVAREQASHGLAHNPAEFIVLDPVPDIEDETAARLQHPPRFAIAGQPVSKEHDAELAKDRIERRVVEWQRQCVGVSPADPGKTWLRCCKIEHCLIYVARDYRHRFGEHASEHAGDDAGPRGDFEQMARAEISQAISGSKKTGPR